MTACPPPTITEVRLTFIQPRQGLFALARIVVADALVLDSIGIHRILKSERYRLTYPTKQGNHLFHPITQPFGHAIEAAILTELSKRLKDVTHDRYGGSHLE